MKKLMTLMLGLSLALGATVSVSFAEDAPKKEENQAKKKGKKKKDGDAREGEQPLSAFSRDLSERRAAPSQRGLRGFVILNGP